MLVTFSCDAYSDITMFGYVALLLLKMMGHSGEVPGAILAIDVPATHDRLKKAIERDKDMPISDLSNDDQDDDSNEKVVSLRHRALPLIDLLAAAAKENCNVMWK